MPDSSAKQSATSTHNSAQPKIATTLAGPAAFAIGASSRYTPDPTMQLMPSPTQSTGCKAPCAGAACPSCRRFRSMLARHPPVDRDGQVFAVGLRPRSVAPAADAGLGEVRELPVLQVRGVPEVDRVFRVE